LDPETGRGWNLRMPALVSFDYAPRLSGGGCDQNPDERFQSLVVSLGLDDTLWGARLGFNVRLLPFFGYMWSRELDINRAAPTSANLVFGAVLEFGLAFPIARK